MTETSTATLPGRLRPTRAGIVGLWDYTDTVFGFADGRLVLRGANGSGKTKALEVLFPFVLDGRLDPRRLDPFSGENRTMKDNLLWRGGETAHGYTWLEFGDGRRHVTVGVGLQAQRHQPRPRSWFFVTDRRVGVELTLVDTDGRPRTRRALTEELGEGAVVERASEHRRRVDDALFGLGPERYDAMLDLALTLRRPMLAKDLDPTLLSDTLTRGLRPLDEELIEQVARSFDDLEAVQRDLDRLVAADDAATAFVTDYRGYLRTQARHRADLAIDADAAVTAATDELTQAERRIDEARATESMTETELDATGTRLAEARARRDALRSSDAFRSVAQLEHLETAVRDLAAEHARAAERATSATAGAEEETATGERAEVAERDAAARAATARQRTLGSAAAAGVEWAESDGTGTAADVRQRVLGRTAARRADLDAVRVALDAVTDAQHRATAAQENVERAQDAERAQVSAIREADTRVAAAGDELLEAIDGWAAAHPDVVEPDDHHDLRAEATAIRDAADDEASHLADRWRRRLQPRVESATMQRAGHDHAAVGLRTRIDELDVRRQAILDERDDAPPALPWHGGDRRTRPGAPLWRLVRFNDDLDPATAAGVEAALEASGLLDAWVEPDGSLGDDDDAFLLAPDAPADGPTAADVLVSEDQDGVAVATIDRLLRALPLLALAAISEGGASEDGASAVVAVGPDGTYRLGPLAGRNQLDAPRYIGATARAAHRAARVAQLDEGLTELRAELRDIEDRIAEVDNWLQQAHTATDALPSEQPLRARRRDRDQAASRLQQARTATAAAEEAAHAARREHNDRQAALDREARTRGLPANSDGIAEVTAALQQFTDDGNALVSACAEHAWAADAAEQARRRTTAAQRTADAAGADADARRRQHATRAAELAALHERLGDQPRQILDQLGELDRAITEGESAQEQLGARLQAAAAERGAAEARLDTVREQLRAARDTSELAYARLRLLARPGVAGPLGLEVPDEPDRLLAAVDELVIGVSGAEERRKAAQTRVRGALEDLDRALGADHRPSWQVDDDVIVVTIASDGRDRSIATFADQLARQRAEQEALLTERERTLFEDALLTSVCGQIHARTQATRELVATMDTQMRARRLSSGQTVGVGWRPDDGASAEWKRVHRLLDQDPAHFGPDQLETLRRHFSTEIADARAADPHAPYRELLAKILDYRRWRRFELSLIEADGSSAPLTRARHARLSGGEKAASLHLPLFAAAHAAFAGGRPGCPRLLGLDEAFAGIDDTGRSELLSLTVAFDLDLFMTGYDLWAIDRTVPGVAHYDLLHLKDAHAVSTLLVLWNGRELLEGPDAELALTGNADLPDDDS